MSETKIVNRISFPLGSILFLIFMTLKLTGVIAWSWWWVTAPLWIPVLLFIGILGCVFVLSFILVLLDDK